MCMVMCIAMCRGVGTGGAGGIGPPPFENMEGAKYVLPHEMCINKCYIY